ncbi:MAG: AIPR family protein [Lachnospiraceae bacterium]|nr:AIPR family protein [Lachnospiraceae bacterium]
MVDKLAEYNQDILEEVASYRANNVVSTSIAFKTIYLSYLAEVGESSISDCQIIDFKKTGEKLRLDGYVFNEYFNTLTLVISDFSANPQIVKTGKVEIEKSVKQAYRFLKKCITDSFDELEESSDGYQAYEYIKACKEDIETVNIILITNKKAVLYVPEDSKLGKMVIRYDVWDIERLYQHVFLNEQTSVIEIKLNKKYGVKLPLIKVEGNAEQPYDCYVGAISGDLLAKIYSDEGQKLIEKNVRSFLQATGKINKGIRDSLKNEPEMFMAYNNGISTIAESIEIDDDLSTDKYVVIKSIKGWQIVNGGQTTASIYNAYKGKIDLSSVSVQMKLAVIKADDKVGEIVANISRYANSQNPIKVSDFSANDDYHIRMERLSRITYIPVTKGKSVDRWFYERARGQYLVEVNRQLTPALKKEFKDHNPKNRCVSKAVAAKCMMCWMGYPEIVSKGLETNFVFFTGLVNDGKIPEANEENYRRMIAEVILFNECDKIVANQKFGGFKAQIDYYTVALLGTYYKEMINLDYMWEIQSIEPEVRLIIEDLVYKVWNHFQNPTTPGVNIGQWCKKDDCWELLKERFENNKLK